MRMRTLCVGVLGVVMSGTPVAAQRPGTVEIGLFTQATKIDKNIADLGVFSVGGRLGIFLLRGLELEGDVANSLVDKDVASMPDGKMSYAPLYLRLAYNMNMGWRGGLIIGGGLVRSDYGVPYAFGANGLVGFRVGIVDRFQVRVDGLMDYHARSEPKATTNLSARIGLSFLPGPSGKSRPPKVRGPRDLDADGISDDLDECKDTPAGVRVDARGCTLPVDSDNDGVVDAADRCPATPAGTPVDTAGCPRQVAPPPVAAPVMPVAPMDTDKDGVADAADRCAGTPMGTKVDMSGCPMVMDADADGVPDSADRCAGTAAGDRVDASGCPLPKDADSDGVVDANDRCPNTPSGATVDATGCTPPPADSDKDGVPNASDRCAETSPGFTVDATGCPNGFKDGFSSVVLRGVTFESGKATLTATSGPMLDAIANILKSTGQRVEIAGHTDNSGTASGNNNLSQSRALAVRAYLIGKGVPATQMVARGYGSKEPIADNATEEGKAINRRVELRKI